MEPQICTVNLNVKENVSATISRDRTILIRKKSKKRLATNYQQIPERLKPYYKYKEGLSEINRTK